MALPNKLKYFNCFFDGDNYYGLIPEVTLPKVTTQTEDYRGGGMIGSVAVNLGLDAGALDASVTLGGIDSGLLKKWGEPAADGMQFRFAGSYQDDSTGVAIPVEAQMRGRFVDLDPGSATAGDDTSHQYTIKNTYYKLTVNGEEIMEVDILNMIYRVNGVDMLAQHRANIGL